MTKSDLTATPPDQPNALCREKILNPANASADALNMFFDYAYANQYYDSNRGQLPTIAFSSSSPYTDQQLDTAGRFPNYNAIIDLTSDDYAFNESDPGVNDIIWTRDASLNGAFLSPSQIGNTDIFVFVSFNQSSSFFEFTFDNAHESNFISYSQFSMASNGPTDNNGDNIFVDKTITITDDEGNTLSTNKMLVGARQANGFQGYSGNDVIQPDIVWEDVGSGIEKAIVGSIPTSLSVLNTDRATTFYGIQLPGTIKIKKIRFDFDRVDQSGSYAFLIGYSKILLFKSKIIESVLPLPEGCVVPTPA